MKARPSTKYYCEPCGEDHPGHPAQTETPVFYIGCCWELEWSGTREQAGELYDYLMGTGTMAVREKCKNGCVAYADDDIDEPYTVWICGECGSEYDEADAKEQAITCCAEVLAARKAEMMEEEGV